MSVSVPQRGADWVRPYVPRSSSRHLAGRARRARSRWWTAPACSSTSPASPGCPSSSPGAAAARAPRCSPTRSARASRTCSAIAYDHGGGLLKFGGDALLLLFDGTGTPTRACRSAVGHARPLLRGDGRSRPAARRSGCTCRSACTRARSVLFDRRRRRTASCSSPAPAATAGRGDGEGGRRRRDRDQHGDGRRARRRARRRAARGPAGCCARRARQVGDQRDDTPWKPAPATSRARSPTGLRAHVLAGAAAAGAPRRDRRVHQLQRARTRSSRSTGPRRAPTRSRSCRRSSQDGRRRLQVCFLGSDIDGDGGKLILTAGAPRAHGDEEERMLLAAAPDHRRRAAAADPHRRPPRRRCSPATSALRTAAPTRSWATSSNLAARLMAKAPPGRALRDGGGDRPLRHALRDAHARAVPVKGKAKPVRGASPRPGDGRADARERRADAASRWSAATASSASSSARSTTRAAAAGAWSSSSASPGWAGRG